MADKKTQGEDESSSAEATMPAVSPVTPPAATSKLAIEVRTTRPRIGSEPERLSKGQRKHMRRQKQAGEFKITRRR